MGTALWPMVLWKVISGFSKNDFNSTLLEIDSDLNPTLNYILVFKG